MDRGTSQTTVREVAKELDTTEWLSLSYKIHTCIYTQKHISTLIDQKIELIFKNYLWDQETYVAIRYLSQTFLYKSNVVKTVMGSETLCYLEVNKLGYWHFTDAGSKPEILGLETIVYFQLQR